jgi:hypothetical protein
MEYNKDLVEAARQAWNIINHRVDSKQKVYTDFKEFEKFYAEVLRTLMEEQEEI